VRRRDLIRSYPRVATTLFPDINIIYEIEDFSGRQLYLRWEEIGNGSRSYNAEHAGHQDICL